MGTVLDVEYATPQPNGSIARERQVTTTGERRAFNGGNPVQFNMVTSTLTTPVAKYRDLVNGNLLEYGLVSPLLGQTNVAEWIPPISDPVDMQPGQVARTTYQSRVTVIPNAGQNVVQLADVQREFTYQGRETFRSAVGTFNACKFSVKQVTSSSGTVVTTNIDIYVAAEGPYRGQQLKVDTSEATQMAYSPK
ncbi:hypothetical protein ASE76_04890 [Xylophilus sp. Leaf220]|nr:hypothetical protein ASE76_04890 [Xylophilus sp. Leaf220]